MDTHRSSYKHWKNGNSSLIRSFTLFDEYGLDDCFIELLEAKACNSKDEMHQIEGKYIRSMVCVNKNVPGRTKTEYYQDHRDEIIKNSKEYYEENKDKINEYKKEYYEINKTKINEQKKEYYEVNKDKIL